MRIMKKLRAQQLIEFLLVVPFMVIILGIITEYAYALNVNLSLYTGIRSVTSTIYSEIKPNMTKADIQDFVKERLENYLVANNIPLSAANDLKINVVMTDDYAAFIVNYTYLSAFTLPNVYFHVLPSQFEFSAVAVVPSGFLKPNKYPSDINSLTLDKIWGTPSSYNSLDAFIPLENGIMQNTLMGGAGSGNMAFIVKVDVTDEPFTPDSPTYYVLNWDGTPVSTVNVADFDANKIYECGKQSFDKDGNLIKTYCDEVGGSPLNYVSGRTNVISIDKDDYRTSYGGASIPTQWLTQGGGPYVGKVLDADGGVLREILGLYNVSGQGSNYDNIDVSAFNPSAATLPNKYKMESRGSYIYVHGNDTFTNKPFGGSGDIAF